MLRYVVRPRADRNIDEVADYLADEAGFYTALQFLTEIHETFSLLGNQQYIGWPCKVHRLIIRHL
jgi:plasmid stabilization system protein ParE